MKRFLLSALALVVIFAVTSVTAQNKDDAVHAAEVASATAPTKAERISNGEKL